MPCKDTVIIMNIKHSIVWNILRPLVAVFLWFKFGYTSGRAKNLPDNYIVLSNHTTDYDPLLVGVTFRRQMYFVASDHISRWKRAYPLIEFAFAPILRKKGMNAAHAIIDILRKLKKGANVCMFAEGVRTWDGVTCRISETTGQLVKRAGCGLVTYKIIGGYFLSPGWSNGTRRGYARGDIVNVYTIEQLAKMSAEEINEAIARDLYEDAYARQLESPKRYRGKRLAEKLENLLFICPECGAHETIRSDGNHAVCDACGMTINIDEYGMLEGVGYKTIRELASWQEKQVREVALRGDCDKMDAAKLFLIVDAECECIETGTAYLGAHGFSMGKVHIPLEDIDDMAIHGRRTVAFSSKKSYYELKPDDGVNALKFVLLYKYYREQIDNACVK